MFVLKIFFYFSRSELPYTPKIECQKKGVHIRPYNLQQKMVYVREPIYDEKERKKKISRAKNYKIERNIERKVNVRWCTKCSTKYFINTN